MAAPEAEIRGGIGLGAPVHANAGSRPLRASPPRRAHRDGRVAACWQSVVEVPRRTETGAAPGWPGATTENTASI